MFKLKKDYNELKWNDLFGMMDKFSIHLSQLLQDRTVSTPIRTVPSKNFNSCLCDLRKIAPLNLISHLVQKLVVLFLNSTQDCSTLCFVIFCLNKRNLQYNLSYTDIFK